MCFSAATMLAMQAGATVLSGISQKRAADAQAAQLNAEAAGERDVGAAQAERILRATRKERGSARAALAASGTALDAFALENERDIQDAGETDAAMAILTGERRGRALQGSAALAKSAGNNALAGSVLRAGGQLYNGWTGSKAPIGPINDDGYSVGTGGAYGGSRKGL